MSGYMPTPEQMRVNYVLGRTDQELITDTEAGEEFDRAMEAVKAEIWDKAVGWDTTDIDGVPVRILTRGNGTEAPNPYRTDRG